VLQRAAIAEISGYLRSDTGPRRGDKEMGRNRCDARKRPHTKLGISGEATMGIDTAVTRREDRRRELLEMWKDRRGQNTVLSLFHDALPAGQSPRAGMSVFDVILQREFGDAAAENEATPNAN
jgi:hypothetical protein